MHTNRVLEFVHRIQESKQHLMNLIHVFQYGCPTLRQLHKLKYQLIFAHQTLELNRHLHMKMAQTADTLAGTEALIRIEKIVR